MLCTASDYSVLLRDIPPNTTVGSIKHYIESFSGDEMHNANHQPMEVVRVVLHYSCADLIENLTKRGTLFQEFSLVAGRIVHSLSREAELEDAIAHQKQTKLEGLLQHTQSQYSNTFASLVSAHSPRSADFVYRATQEIHTLKIKRRQGNLCSSHEIRSWIRKDCKR